MSGRRAPRARGFTLIEMLITLVAAGVIGGAVTGLFRAQHGFYGKTDGTLAAMQNLRASLDLMSAEIRMAGPADLLLAGPASVALRFDLTRGVVCDTLAGGEAELFVYDSVASANVPAAFRGTAYAGPYDGAYVYADGFTPVSSVSTGARASCRGAGADPSATAAASSFRRTSGWTAAYGVTPRPGSLVRSYGRLEYSFGRSTSAGGDALRRNGQELATPFEAGARFEYLMDDGTVQASVVRASLANVRAVRVVAVAVGDAGNPYGVRRAIAYEIPLRN